MARLAGFEPTTPSFGGLYAIHLRHSRVELPMIPWAPEKPKPDARHCTASGRRLCQTLPRHFPIPVRNGGVTRGMANLQCVDFQGEFTQENPR